MCIYIYIGMVSSFVLIDLSHCLGFVCSFFLVFLLLFTEGQLAQEDPAARRVCRHSDVCMCMYVCIHIYIYIYTHMYVYSSLPLSLYTYVYVCMYVCMCIYIYVYGFVS